MMKAIVIEQFGGPENLVLKDGLPAPKPQKGEVVIKVKAFGINRAETYMRKGEWAESVPISGIEAVGIVEACPGGEFKLGTPVATVMGGLGRTRNGSYAEYTSAVAENVVDLGDLADKLSWAQLAALPESYATAWTVMFRNLELQKGDKLLVRGGTSALGRAAINLAVNAGAIVTATSRNPERFEGLKALGVDRVVQEGPNLSQRLPEKFDKILELVGNSVLLDSLQMLHRGGRLGLAGFLGGLAPISDFNPLAQMASGVHFSFFGSFVFGTPEFPLSDVPLRDIVAMVAEKKFNAEPLKVFQFNETDVREAHRLVDNSKANGKLVVVVE